MELSFFLAKVMGLYLLIVALAILFNQKSYLKMMDEFIKNQALVYFSGVIALILGILLVVSHNVWRTDWTVVITVIGWLALIKGSLLLFFPNAVLQLAKKLNDKNRYIITGGISFILGIYLTYKGFFV